MILMNRDTFKIITASAGLEEGAVILHRKLFSCPGYKVVETGRIRCHKSEDMELKILKGIQNSCNPVFIEVGFGLGVDRYYQYFRQFGLLDITGIDLPGEAGTIMHKEENMGQVELATIVWTVVSDYTDPAGSNSECTDQWRQTGDTAFWSGSVEERRKKGENICIRKKSILCLKRQFQTMREFWKQ